MKTLIKNAIVVDGSGKKPFNGSVLIDGDKIAGVYSDSAPENVKSDVVLDAEKRVLTPGFIDIHRHCDYKPFSEDNSYADVMLSQGITSVTVGNCGFSIWPDCYDPKAMKEVRAFDEPVLGPQVCSFDKFSDYYFALSKKDLPVNWKVLIGTGSIRKAIKGFSKSKYSEEEMKTSLNMIKEALDNGASGLSSGIMYNPECFSLQEEFVKQVSLLGSDRVWAVHMRGEGDSLVKSVAEAINIAEKAGVRLEISHFKSCGADNWGREIYKAIECIENARKRGVSVSCDFYPYTGGSTALTTMLPPVFADGDINKAIKLLETKEGVDEFRTLASVKYADWDNFCITLGWKRIIISSVVNEKNRKMIGMNVEEAAEKFGFEDAFALAGYLISDEKGKTAIINLSMVQEDVDSVAKLPYSTVISDSIYAKTDSPHPRMYGSFPKIIREYVMERKILTIEEAVRKMTSQPAAVVGFEKRGLIATGCFADINLFYPQNLKDYATYTKPTELSSGIDYCFINGQPVISDGTIVNRTCGVLE